MTIFEGRYFKLNKMTLTWLGFRPYGTMKDKVLRMILIILSFLMMMPHGISAIMYHKDVDRLMLNLVCFLTLTIVSIKLTTLNATEKQFEELYDSIAASFETIQVEEERQILLKYSERGRFLTIAYCITMVISGMVISVLPVMPAFLDKVYPLQEPRAKLHLMEGEYFFDREAHPVVMFCCETAATTLVVLTSLGVDPMYMAAAEHACALYAIISYRLKNMNPKMNNDVAENLDDLYDQLCFTIKLHQGAMRFTLTMNDSYSNTFLYIMVVSIALIPLDACAIIANLHSSVGYLPYVLLFTAVMIHLLMVFYPGQRILDHGDDLYFDACCNEWYNLPQRMKKLLLIFMLRCTQPAALAGGGLFFVEFATYAKIIKTSVSYITVLASFRNE